MRHGVDKWYCKTCDRFNTGVGKWMTWAELVKHAHHHHWLALRRNTPAQIYDIEHEDSNTYTSGTEEVHVQAAEGLLKFLHLYSKSLPAKHPLRFSLTPNHE